MTSADNERVKSVINQSSREALGAVGNQSMNSDNNNNKIIKMISNYEPLVVLGSPSQ